MHASLIAVLTVALSAPLAAQWLNHPTPDIPRTPDGKPNLAAPAPRTPDGKPDLSGLWNKVSPKYSRNIVADLKPEDVQPWAQALVERRKEDLGKDYMNVHCVPLGPGYATSADSTGAEMMKIVQTLGADQASDERKGEKQVAPEVLAKYVGIYEEQPPLWRAAPRIVEITVSNGRLLGDMDGRGKVPLIASSDTTFSGLYGLGVEFIAGGSGALLVKHVSGNYRFARK